MIKAILFDIDKVIAIGGYFTTPLEKDYGIPISVTFPFFKTEFIDCLLGKTDLKDVLKNVLPMWGWKGSVEELLAYWFESENVVDQNLIHAISDLRKRNIKCYTASNQEKYRTQYIKSEMHFDEIFDAVFTSSQIGYKKPQKEFFEHILQTIEFSPEEVLYFDDHAPNIEAANELGIKGYLYKDFSDFENAVKKYNLRT